MKLDIGDVFYSAGVALWRGGRPMAVCLVLWLVAEVAYSFVGRSYGTMAGLLFTEPVSRLLDVRSLDVPTYQLVTRTVSGVARDLLGCVFITAMLRIVLVGPKAVWGAGPGGFARAAGAILLASLAVTLAVNAMRWLHTVLADITGPADWSGLADAGASFLYVIVLVYLTARLCLVFPSASVGRGWALARNLRRTADNSIRLSAVFAIVALVGVTASGLLEMVFYAYLFAIGGPSNGLFPPEGFPWLHWFLIAREIGVSVLTKVFLLTLSAVAYARLTEFPAAGIPAAGKTPEQLADAFE